MLPMHEELSIGRLIVPRVRQVVNCLLFSHYLLVTWPRRRRQLPVFSVRANGQIEPGRAIALSTTDISNTYLFQNMDLFYLIVQHSCLKKRFIPLHSSVNILK